MQELWKPAPVELPAFASVGEFDTQVETVGLWDTTGLLSNLYPLVEFLNKNEDQVIFYELMATPPTGFERIPGYIDDDSESRTQTEPAFARSVPLTIASRCFERAKRLRTKFELSRLVVLVRHPIEDNRFTTSQGGLDLSVDDEGTCIVSLGRHEDYAAQPGKQFEVISGKLIVASLLSSMYPERYHAETRACLFDLPLKGVLLSDGARNAKLCSQCARALGSLPLVQTLRAISSSLGGFDHDNRSWNAN